MSTDWKQQLQTQRQRKEEYFAESEHSPLAPHERADFDGLSHYPPDEDYRFRVRLHEHEEKERVTVATSTDGEQEYLRWGEFRVEIDGEAVVVQAYKSDPDEDRLWVPFRDATSGDETYGAGRYIDLEADEHRSPDGWLLDFNQAYNPTCAYSDRYECPLPPGENWLEVPIEAGEKAYH